MKNFDKKIGNPLLLGASKIDGGVNFAITVEDRCPLPVLRIYEKGTYNAVCDLTFEDDMKFGNIYAMEVEKLDHKSYDYGYICDEKPFADPYAKIVNYNDKWGEAKVNTYGIFYDEYSWGENRNVGIPFDEAIIYRMHVRGFTAHKSSGTKYKGTFKGVVSKLPYLKDLGVNVIELMPAYDFDEVKCDSRYSSKVLDSAEKQSKHNKQIVENFSKTQDTGAQINYWGYSDAWYFAPKAAYAYDKANVSREFKDMVQAIHDAGMELVMEFHFVDGMKPHMIMDCIRYWVMEYHIDGVHINLNAVPVNMMKTDPLLSKIKILGDRWELVSDYHTPVYGDKNLGISNDGFMCTIRKFLKGDEGLSFEVSSKLKENPKDAGIVNYLSTHNSFTLMDCVSYDRKHNEANGENNRDGSNLNYSWNCGFEGATRKKKVVELRRKQIKNALTMLMLSQGTPLIMSGDEMGRTCDGNNNPYCQDNNINYINWNDLTKNKEIFEFVKFIINYRKSHKMFHLKEEPRMMDYLSKGCPDLSIHGIEPWRPDFNYVCRCFGMMYNEAYDGKCGKIYIMFNMYWEQQEFNVPANEPGMKWTFEFDTTGIPNDEIIVGRVYTVPPRAIVVLKEVEDLTKKAKRGKKK